MAESDRPVSRAHACEVPPNPPSCSTGSGRCGSPSASGWPAGSGPGARRPTGSGRRGRVILFGKLAARVGSLLLFLLAGLPILGLMQFVGGIDPDLVLAGFAATFATVLPLAAVGIAASVMSRKVRDAIALTYLVAI